MLLSCYSITRILDSQHVGVGQVEIHSQPPQMSHDDHHPHEYEDIQELHDTNCNDGGLPDEPNTFTQLMSCIWASEDHLHTSSTSHVT